MARRTRGRVKWFDSKKGYGFIIPDEKGQDVFVHYLQIVGQKAMPNLPKDAYVQFELIQTPKGPAAKQVVLSADWLAEIIPIDDDEEDNEDE